MDDDDRRREAWTYALYGEGTRAIFQTRAEGLRKRTFFRDFVGLGVPIILAYLLGAEEYPALKPYREYAVAALGIAAVAQTLMVAWSLLKRWDEELVYAIRTAGESYQLKESWKKLGRGEAMNLRVEYEVLSRQQAIVDSHDVLKSVSDGEKRTGMRKALRELQRTCVCGEVPKRAKAPFRPKHPCDTCGGN